MNRTACTAVFTCEGTAALKPRAPRRLTLIEGGCPAAAEAPRAGALGRGQVLVALLAGLAVVAAVTLASVASDAVISVSRTRALEGVATTTITVAPGDSLWGIAAERPVKGVDTAELARWISETNALSDATLRPGQTLRVPARS